MLKPLGAHKRIRVTIFGFQERQFLAQVTKADLGVADGFEPPFQCYEHCELPLLYACLYAFRHWARPLPLYFQSCPQKSPEHWRHYRPVLWHQQVYNLHLRGVACM